MIKNATPLIFKKILLNTGWAENVEIEIDGRGLISKITPHGTPQPGAIDGIAIAGMVNAHSHAFQRAFAGKTEKGGQGEDNFWGWRQVMYRALKAIGPVELKMIAAQLYVEMLKAGYTGVAEFHYLHNRRDGSPYKNPAIMSEALISAASEAGIGFTLLPVLYMQSDFGEKTVNEDQRVFANTLTQFRALLRSLKGKCPLGLALHSLRAVPVEVIREAQKMAPGGPIHIHIAEQGREVTSCLKFHGKRPVEWLLENVALDEKWHLVHATHINEVELRAIAKSGATVILCPTTEANLGDGIFPFEAFVKEGGRFAIGSDSHVSIDPREELRLLEYGQRLTLKRRAIAGPNPGLNLWQGAVNGGARTIGNKVPGIAVGARANIVVLDGRAASLAGSTGEEVLDALVFAGQPSPVRDVMAGGIWRVKNYRHPAEDVIRERFLTVLAKL